jgi:two-component system CheB/CheR fusion protein
MKKKRNSLTAKSLNNVARQENFLIVGVGASAGGIQALQEFFKNVPKESECAYVVILHLSPDHDSKLVEVLKNVAEIPVNTVTKKNKSSG